MAPVVKNSLANAGDIRDTILGQVDRAPGGGYVSPLHYSCLENPMDREAWWATVHGVPKSWTQLKQLACTHTREELTLLVTF